MNQVLVPRPALQNVALVLNGQGWVGQQVSRRGEYSRRIEQGSVQVDQSCWPAQTILRLHPGQGQISRQRIVQPGGGLLRHGPCGRFACVLVADAIGQALAFRISLCGRQGRKAQFHLDQRIVASGVAHERLDEGRRPALEHQPPAFGPATTRCQDRPARLIDAGDGISGKSPLRPERHREIVVSGPLRREPIR